MHFGTLTPVWVLPLLENELTPFPHSRLLRWQKILSLTGQLGISPLGCPVSISTLWPTSGEAEL